MKADSCSSMQGIYENQSMKSEIINGIAKQKLTSNIYLTNLFIQTLFHISTKQSISIFQNIYIPQRIRRRLKPQTVAAGLSELNSKDNYMKFTTL